MRSKGWFGFMSLVLGVAAAAPGVASAHRQDAPQACSLGSAGVGQRATLVCKDIATGDTTQAIAVGNTVSGAGAVGGNLSRADERVLVTNQAGGALLFRVDDGRLTAPVTLQTGGEGSLSGALGRRGAYVLTGTRLLFFPRGQTAATSSRPLLIGDGSAAQVALAGDYAYVSEKSGSLEAFRLAHDGSLAAAAAPVTGIPAGVIVGITGADDEVVAPVAHLASNFAQAAIPVVAGLGGLQVVATKEVAACWTNHEDDEVCVSNPGSMTVSCGRLGSAGFESYTSVAANPVGDAIFDLDMRDRLIAIHANMAGVPMLLVYSRDDDRSDFLTLVRSIPLGTTVATGALLLQ